ncbi:coiled-coil-helix-coiled-coil-helix domain containing 7 [Nesidiocoris tenuis]|uniref:Coiled-coil-helix-coiled-coil-helix domain-containing protein 7 n=1 Tax=Nesidiocoris tenuis TaxID=355587 RepID=A0ABN7BHK8_9HEMI|nr:coiled-coil-helix-coiled-coil-helix domain containing 7 [Nesidiocoris tenuis]
MSQRVYQSTSQGNTVARSQINNAENNPCYKESKQSLKCLSDNNYDHDACQLHFQNYRSCREFWTEVQRLRNRKGISPTMPSIEERKQIQEIYKKSGKIEV